MTALKFSAKIREVVAKKGAKESKRVKDLEDEFAYMSRRISEYDSIGHEMGAIPTNEKLLEKYNELKQKY